VWRTTNGGNAVALICMGTRPEIIKMAPVYRALKNSRLGVAILHTGQHEEMAWPLYEFFGMRPDHCVNLNRSSSALSHLSARLLEEVAGVLEVVKPKVVLVHGDTSSTLSAALAAFYQQIPIGHVEAGLRSGSMYDPFPEEMNRALVGRVAQWHFAPTAQAAENLRREGVPRERIHIVGNTIVDAALWGCEQLERRAESAAELIDSGLGHVPTLLQKRDRKLILVTAHRRENWGGGIAGIAQAVRRLLEEREELCVVWPVHANRIVRDTVYVGFQGMEDSAAKRLVLCEPLNYTALLWVLRHAWITMTDSGGIQEEAIAVKVPVLVLRETTERPELLAAGGGVLVGTDPRAIVERVRWLLEDEAAHRRMRSAKNPFGDGHAAEYIARILEQALVPQDISLSLPQRPCLEEWTARAAAWKFASSSPPRLPAN